MNKHDFPIISEEVFTRQNFYDAYSKQHGTLSKNALDYALRKEVSAGTIIHIGRNQYTYTKKRSYIDIIPHYFTSFHRNFIII